MKIILKNALLENKCNQIKEKINREKENVIS